MKKIMMMALMAVAATTAFAQDALVKEAKKLTAKGEFDAAVEMLRKAVNSSETLDKAAAWNEMVQANYGKYNAIQTAEMENKVKKQEVPYDTVGMNHAAVEAFKAAMKCDEFDRQPNEKGKVKIRFRQPNQQKMLNVRLAMINAGLYEYNHKNLDGALDCWKLYLDSPTNEFFTGMGDVTDVTKDQYRSEIAYYAGLVAYQKKDYVTAVKYATLAAQDPAKADDANEIMLFSKKETLKNKADSLEYLAMLKDLRKQNPEEDRYFNLLMDYYTRANDQVALKAWAEEEIAINPANKMAWALKGEVQMNDREWDAAVESYKKAAEIDPDFVQVIFNAGVCLNSKAIDLKDELADKNTGGLTKANADRVKAILADAKVYLEKSKELDPFREKVNWAYPLYQIYYSLGDEANANEMEKLVNSK